MENNNGIFLKFRKPIAVYDMDNVFLGRKNIGNGRPIRKKQLMLVNKGGDYENTEKTYSRELKGKII